MKTNERDDLNRRSKLAFRRMESCDAIIRQFHALPANCRAHNSFNLLQEIYSWLLVPFSLWPVDMAGIVIHVLKLIESGKKLDRETIILLELVAELPSIKTRQAITEHEHQVKGGSYETLIKAQHKFDLREKALNKLSNFRQDWDKIKSEFDICKYQDSKGIIRRRVTQERNFHPPDWDFKWKTKEERFRIIFDAFCHKWVLYGMEKDKPLLQKLSVNVTPFGTMIFIPRYWSLDRKRDLKWRAITQLHHSRDVQRQGPKFSVNQMLRVEEARRARKYWEEATSAGLKGAERMLLVKKKLSKVPETDDKQIRRLLKFFG